MTPIRWTIFAVACLIVLGLAIVTNKQSNTPAFTGDAGKVITTGPIADHVFGSTAQKVTLIEYGDFECPACEAMYPSVQQIKAQYKDNLTFVFRNMPLTNIHPNALAAATAAEAAGLQGKFFEMYQQLYDQQPVWGNANVSQRANYFEQYARQIGLNLDKYRKDLNNPSVDQKIQHDIASSRTFDVTGTPTFILNGQKLSETTGASGQKLAQAVADALKQAGFTVAPPNITGQ